ncbi:MAG: hypothetical protein U0L72_03935, partial [Acutalibacteraceae bacterium]|nr:hypothetical protein [Acutalibacteraceae bacterium]
SDIDTHHIPNPLRLFSPKPQAHEQAVFQDWLFCDLIKYCIVVSKEEQEICRKICESVGATLRIRPYEG